MDDSSIYSCDDHLDLRSVPRQLWQDRLPKDLVNRGPRVVTGEGDPMWVCNDRVLGRSGLPQGDKLQVLSAVSRAGLEDDGFRVSDPKLRLEDMDLDGVWASVIYGPIPLTLSIPEPDLQTACYSAWNDWAIEEFKHSLPIVSVPSPSSPATRRRRPSPSSSGCGEGPPRRDHRRFDFDAGDPAWDRLWAAAEKPDCRSASTSRRRIPEVSYQVGKWQSAAFATLLPAAARRGARHHGLFGRPRAAPRPHAGPGRVGRRWLPYFLSRMDMEWENLRDKIDYAPSVAPSELFRRQVIATFEEEGWPRNHSAPRGRLVHVGGRLSAHRQHVPRVARAIEETLGMLPDGGSSQDHGAELRQAVRLRVCRLKNRPDYGRSRARYRSRRTAVAEHRTR